jgi:HSP20 family protein
MRPGEIMQRNRPSRRDLQQAGQTGQGRNDLMNALRFDIDRVLEDVVRAVSQPLGATNLDPRQVMPRVDVRDADDAVEIQAEMPGVDEADIEVSLAPGALLLRGETRAERDQEDRDFVVRERAIGRFERVIPLPDGLDLDSATASFDNGVLTIRIAKTEESRTQARRIPVQQFQRLGGSAGGTAGSGAGTTTGTGAGAGTSTGGRSGRQSAQAGEAGNEQTTQSPSTGKH